MNKTNSRRRIKLVFIQEQIDEQVEFVQDLKQGKVETAFEGSFSEGMAFLKKIHKLAKNTSH